MGKTSMAINIIYNQVLKGECTALMFSLEMDRIKLAQQLLAIQSNILLSQIHQAKFDVAGWEKISLELQELATRSIFIDQDSRITVITIASRIRQLQKKLQDANRPPLSLIVIDYLQLMAERSQNQLEAIGEITRQLKLLASEVNVPIVCLSQLSRTVESRNDKRPMMSDVRGCGYVEEDADVIIGMYRDEYYNPDTADRGIAEAIVIKQRSGPRGTAQLLFDPTVGVFKNLRHRQ